MVKNLKPVPVADQWLHVPRNLTDSATAWWFFIDVQLDSEIPKALELAQTKPARVLPRRDRQYLIEIANGAFTNKQGQIFYNPTERQLDKIFEGELYGYC